MPETCPSENLTGAENEQGSPTETDLAWFAGHMDGDGWIGLIRRMRSATKRYYRYSASLSVVTTSDRNAERVKEILRLLGVNFHERLTEPTIGKDGSPRRRKWHVQVVSNRDARVVLEAIRPYLVEKDRCAGLTLNYIIWRESQPRRPGGHDQKLVRVMQVAAEETMDFLRADRQRHDRRDPSTTTRLAPTSPVG